MKLDKAKGITIGKAINLNNTVLRIFDAKLEEIEKAAILLGIEALERTKARRELLGWKSELLLPGETK